MNVMASRLNVATLALTTCLYSPRPTPTTRASLVWKAASAVSQVTTTHAQMIQNGRLNFSAGSGVPARRTTKATSSAAKTMTASVMRSRAR